MNNPFIWRVKCSNLTRNLICEHSSILETISKTKCVSYWNKQMEETASRLQHDYAQYMNCRAQKLLIPTHLDFCQHSFCCPSQMVPSWFPSVHLCYCCSLGSLVFQTWSCLQTVRLSHWMRILLVNSQPQI
jgi:hypothetical protein